MDGDEILDLIDRFVAGLNAHDLEGALGLITDDFVFESTSPTPDECSSMKARLRSRRSRLKLSNLRLHSDSPQEEPFFVPPRPGRCAVALRLGRRTFRSGVDLIESEWGRISESYAYVKGSVEHFDMNLVDDPLDNGR